MKIETERLILRKIREADFGRLWELHNDRLVVDSIYDGTYPTSSSTKELLVSYLHHWERFGFGFFAVFLKGRDNECLGEFVGRRGLRYLDGTTELELCSCFFGRYSGCGLSPESGNALISFAFDKLNAPRVSAVVRLDNERSLRSVAKMGFQHVDDIWHRGRVKRLFQVHNQQYDAKLNEDLKAPL